MIVISDPDPITNETAIINRLFEAGLKLFHIRKPCTSRVDMEKYIDEIHSSYHPKLVLHQHFEITAKFEIHRLHFTEKKRAAFNAIVLSLSEGRDWIFSTSTHSIEDFNTLSSLFQYAFLSPVFESISKAGYNPVFDLDKTMKRRENFSTRLIALGGIDNSNCRQVLHLGFDGVALLGAIWKTTQPVAIFKECLNTISHG